MISELMMMMITSTVSPWRTVQGGPAKASHLKKRLKISHSFEANLLDIIQWWMTWTAQNEEMLSVSGIPPPPLTEFFKMKLMITIYGNDGDDEITIWWWRWWWRIWILCHHLNFFHCGVCDFSKDMFLSCMVCMNHARHFISQRIVLANLGLGRKKICWCERNVHHCSWNKMHPIRLWTLSIEGAYSACTN